MIGLDRTIGIELEMYHFGHNKAGTLTGLSAVSEWIRDNNIDGFHTSIEGSLGASGAEVKFDGPVCIKDSATRIVNMHRMCIDPTLDVTFGFSGRESRVPKDVLKSKKFKSVNVSGRGSTGLHIHFGHGDCNILDVLRLLDYMIKNHKTICKLAWRKNSDWARPPVKIFKYILDTITRDKYGMMKDLCYARKDEGVNLKNFYKGFHTVEFRYAHASLLSDLDAFDEYFKFLYNAIDKCFTGERELVIKGRRLVLDPDNKILEVYRHNWISKGIINTIRLDKSYPVTNGRLYGWQL